jgi:hypothetical protein
MDGLRTRHVTIALPASGTGKTPKKCPRPDCQPGDFLLGAPGNARADSPKGGRRREPNGPGITCPYCGHDGPDDAFRHPVVSEHIERQKAWEVQRFGADLLDKLVAPFEERLRGIECEAAGGAIGISFEVTRTREPLPDRPATKNPDDLLRNVACSVCGREYGVYAIGLFCPGCGSPNLAVHLECEAALIAAELSDIPTLLERGDLERAARRLANAHEDAASVIEAHLKAIFTLLARTRLPPTEANGVVERILNDFQNVEKSRKQFAKFGFDPYAGLTVPEVELLDGMMSKRHVVAHNLGVVDQRFVKKGGGGNPGTNLSLESKDVLHLVEVFRAVVRYCEERLPEFGGTT